MLLQRCDENKAIIRLNTSILSIESPKKNAFILTTKDQKLCCESLVIATGGLSIPTMGATGFGYSIAKQFQLPVYPTQPGLVPFTLNEKDKATLSLLSGVSIDARVRCNKIEFNENILFTHRGLSGPAILQASSYWQQGKPVMLTLAPNLKLKEQMITAKQQGNKMSVKTFLQKYFPKRLVDIWLSDYPNQLKIADTKDKTLIGIAAALQNWMITPNGTEGYRTAEVTLGGIDTNSLSSQSFETKAVPGLYFIGEVIDVTGWLGGYNFQWAWSSGYAAGTYA